MIPFPYQANGERIYIRDLRVSDAAAILALRMRNQNHLAPNDPIRPEEFYTITGQQNALSKGIDDWMQDRSYGFGIFLKENDHFIGRVGLNNVVRGPAQFSDIGYFIDMEHTRMGYVSEAVQLVVKFAFEIAKLHRVQAGVMPWNRASIGVMDKTGFEYEGLARQYILINGKWEDHRIYSRINDQLTTN
jgi:ribosomal-protein-alanine N-acetyltransferase